MDDCFIRETPARELAGGVCKMTFLRWREDGIIPQPIKLRGQNYWRRQELLTRLGLIETA